MLGKTYLDQVELQKERDDAFGSGLMAGLCFCMAALIMVAMIVHSNWKKSIAQRDEFWQKKLVEHGVACYDDRTGEWKIIEPPKEQ